jgi:DNA-binding transcriptional MerR regulator
MLCKSSPLKIGAVATLTGLPVKTIRYYDDIGLLTPTVARSNSKYRLFDPAVLDRLAFVKRAKSFGLSLTEIRDILAIRDRGELPCDEVKRYLQQHRQAITEQIQALEQLRAELDHLLLDWQPAPPMPLAAHTICPNLQPA